MKIIHYNPKERGIRFFHTSRRYFRERFKNVYSISDSKNVYQNFFKSEHFLDSLRQRQEYSDIVLVMAHGWKDSILKTNKNGYERDITLDKTKLLAHNFVFALSCFTFEEFGEAAVDNGALVYIGFDDTIENFFQINDDKYKYLCKQLEIVIKKIYMQSFIIEFNNFIASCRTANEFYQYLSLRIEKEISNLKKIPIEIINKRFDIGIKNIYEKKIRKLIKMQIIGKVNEINSKMKIEGDLNYMPWLYIQEQTNEKLYEMLEKSKHMIDHNYKYFLQSLIYKKLGDEVKLLETVEKELEFCKQTGQPCFISQFIDSEVAATTVN